MSHKDEGLDRSVAKEISTFGFGTEVAKEADARTVINSPEMGLQLLKYRALSSQYDSDLAGFIATVIEKLQVSFKGLGREQAVQALQQKFPKSEKMMEGTETVVARSNEE